LRGANSDCQSAPVQRRQRLYPVMLLPRERPFQPQCQRSLAKESWPVRSNTPGEAITP
jgi:hypothetical protein